MKTSITNLNILFLISILSKICFADADLELDQITNRINSTVDNVNSEILRVQNDTSRTSQETSSVKRSITDTNHRLSGIDNEISQIILENQRKLNTISSHNLNIENFEKNIVDFKKQRQLVIDQLPDLLKLQYKINNEILVESEKLSKLKNFENKLVILKQNNNKINLNHANFMKVSNLYFDEYDKWVKKFNEVIQLHSPNFYSIQDYETFNFAYNDILRFITTIPNEKKIIELEESLNSVANYSVQLLDDQENILRDLPKNHGFSIVSKLTNDDRNNIKYKFVSNDESLQSFKYEMHRTKNLISRFKEKRAYLVHTIPTFWFQLIKTRLHAVNSQEANTIIVESINSINIDRIRFGLENELVRKSNEITKYLRTHLAPRTSRQMAIESLEYLQNTRKQVLEMRLNENFRRDLLALLDTYKRSFNAKILQASSSINDPSFSEERKRQVNVRLNGLGDKLSPICKNMSEIILGTDLYSKIVEENFLTFKEQCVL